MLVNICQHRSYLEE